MTTMQKIQADFLVAFKEKKADTLSTLRLLKSALKNKEIEVIRTLTEEEVLAVVKSQIKQLSDALAMYQSAKRMDLADAAQKEIQVLEGYLPAQLTDEELSSVVKEALKDASLSGPSAMGQAMGVAMKAVNGRADGGRVRGIVQGLLSAFVLLFVMCPSVRAASFEDPISSFASINMSEVVIMVLRYGRVVLAVLAIMAISMILKNAFSLMLCSGRGDDKAVATQSIAGGIMATMFVTVLFTVATVVLHKIS